MTITYLKGLIDSIEKTKDSIKYFISMKNTVIEAINIIIKSEEAKLKLLEDELNIVKYTIKDIRVQK